MRNSAKTMTAGMAVVLSLGAPEAVSAATILGWNTDNVAVPTEPVADGETGVSVVYDRALNPDGSVPVGATSSGQIVFSPPEAVSPGIKVAPESYTQGGPSDITLDGCIMTSNPAATCTSDFQSGKRVKEQMTGFDPVDLVFDIDSSSTETSIYQVFGRLINVTGAALSGFSIELGFGTGADFVAATAGGGLSFSDAFRAQPSGSGSVSTQYPFGLFGDAEDNDNFLLDGFFASERTGLTTEQTATTITSTGFYGPYGSLFGPWLDQASVPTGLFWDFDDDDATDALLMAWETAPGIWELRREATETCDPDNPAICTPGATLGSYVGGLTFEDMVALLGVDEGLLDVGGIEDLANLNLNYAVALGDLGGATSFTLRTTVFAAPLSAVPVPPAAPLLAGAVMLLGVARRRRAARDV